VGLLDTITGAATRGWQDLRLGIAGVEDLYDKHVLDNPGTHVRDYASEIGLISPTADDAKVAELVETAADQTPVLSEMVRTTDALRDAANRALPPGPLWVWALVGLAVLGFGAAVTAKVLA
jgi:hypothetical protein